jgi:uncharacterized protein
MEIGSVPGILLIYSREIWFILREMGLYLLFGIILAGFLSPLIGMVSAFGKRKTERQEILLYSLAGIPLPLCSCSVLPFALGIRRQGGSRAASLAFLTSTPQTGVDSIMVATAFFGLPFALFKMAVAFISGAAAGASEVLFNTRGADRSPFSEKECSAPECGCAPGADGQTERNSFRLKSALLYGYNEIFRDIAPMLSIGILISAAIALLFPLGSLAGLGDGVLAYTAVLLLSLPLYVCATSSIPIAWSLVSAGMAPGAAIVFLIAGPASNASTLGVLTREYGTASTLRYLILLILISVGAGILFDLYMPGSLVKLGTAGSENVNPAFDFALTAAGILLGGLLLFEGIRATVSRLFRKKSAVNDPPAPV